ncbi:DNA polymerase lambda isoform X3 [Paroedura picta]|uniref:DNA polymerase lambda isoform X3 n=1 Tax=Paroedura picta TaxID=143630 RepID=UPI004056B842
MLIPFGLVLSSLEVRLLTLGERDPCFMELQGIVKAFPKRKKIKDDSHKAGLTKVLKREETRSSHSGWLEPVVAYVLQAGMGQARAEIFRKQIMHNGGRVCSHLSSDITHVVLDESMDCDRACRLLKLTKLPPGLQLVKASWLSLCVAEQKMLSTTGYSLFIPDRYLDVADRSKRPSLLLDEEKIQSQMVGAVQEMKGESQASSPCSAVSSTGQWTAKGAGLCTLRVSDDEGSEGEDPDVTQGELEALRSGQDLIISSGGSSVAFPTGKWVCAQSSELKKINQNQCITEKLEVLAKAYSVQGDKWRALGYSKAINALKSYPKPITSYQEACKIPGIGKQMAEKILEILESGHLRKLDHINESVSVLEVFSNIWGAGVKTAQLWYQQVREAAEAIKPGLVCVACGSFRRGKPTCGDVDVLVTHPDGHSHQGVFSKLLDRLRKTGFLTDDLVSQEDNGNQKKYLGVCRLPGPDRCHRRLDIIVVPYSEFACALLYFTGSAHFNRSMRALARTKGMSLSEHALSKGVVRGPGGLKTGSGIILPTVTEKDVFVRLGLPYREPHERDW